MNKDYLFTIRFQFKDMDDPAARKRVKNMLENMYFMGKPVSDIDGVKTKLQRLQDGKEPEGIKI